MVLTLNHSNGMVLTENLRLQENFVLIVLICYYDFPYFVIRIRLVRII